MPTTNQAAELGWDDERDVAIAKGDGVPLQMSQCGLIRFARKRCRQKRTVCRQKAPYYARKKGDDTRTGEKKNMAMRLTGLWKGKEDAGLTGEDFEEVGRKVRRGGERRRRRRCRSRQVGQEWVTYVVLQGSRQGAWGRRNEGARGGTRERTREGTRRLSSHCAPFTTVGPACWSYLSQRRRIVAGIGGLLPKAFQPFFQVEDWKRSEGSCKCHRLQITEAAPCSGRSLCARRKEPGSCILSSLRYTYVTIWRNYHSLMRKAPA